MAKVVSDIGRQVRLHREFHFVPPNSQQELNCDLATGFTFLWSEECIHSLLDRFEILDQFVNGCVSLKVPLARKQHNLSRLIAARSLGEEVFLGL